MEDALTEAPPPSRFFNEDLDNFIKPSPPLPSPFLLFSDPNSNLLSPSLLIIAISSPSLHLLHQISSKTLIGSLILPEVPFSGNSIEPSPKDKSCNIYSINGDDGRSILLVLTQFSISPERSHTVAKLLIDGNKIHPEKVLILDSIESRNFRGKLPPDEILGFKLETMEEKLTSEAMVKGLDYFPSGSVIDGISAALLARCQIKKIRATLCVTWPQNGYSVISYLKSVVLKDVLPKLTLSSVLLDSDLVRDSRYESELYT
ncbi:hypothetical protein C5167_009100 [Papaver somniferum]|uniref:Proteasome assembly chaperone 1 n=1 Tax=Papaver somniferum TaxID=3469 RepID=A0A4Y7JXI1_PAPSO|nr:uncharacterized protein LOC113287653 [Papaver somniferum]RZC65407.1 hypothetical protein C5167_009100 [Papaver somniferum]